MNVVDRSEFRSADGKISLQNRLRGTFQYGPRWYAEMTAQQVVTDRLNKSLHAEQTLIRNLPVPGTFQTLPMILVGPQGVRVLLATPIGGVFRAKGDDWMSFHGGSRHFRRSRPNYQTEVVEHSRKVTEMLKAQGYELPEIESVLIFTNPRTHIDTARPRTRIVQADAIEHFAANLLQFPDVMNQEDVRVVVDALLHPAAPEAPVQPAAPAAAPPPPAARPAPPVRPPADPAAPFKSQPVGRRPRPAPAVAEVMSRPRPSLDQPDQPPPAPRRRRGMSARQWILIVLLFLGEVAVIAAAAYLVFSGALPLPF
jgi:hypothetical protein